MSHEKCLFPRASYRDFYFTITDDQWLIFFPDMGDFVPKWNFDQKSIQNPTKWLSSQMSKLWISAIFDQNSQKINFFHKSWMKSLFYENNIVFNGFLRFWGFQKCVWCGFYHIWNWFNQNFENCVMVNSCEFGNILDFDIWLESHLVGFCIEFWSKFHLGTKSPMSGKRMSHRLSVFEKIQTW